MKKQQQFFHLKTTFNFNSSSFCDDSQNFSLEANHIGDTLDRLSIQKFNNKYLCHKTFHIF